MSRFEDNIGLVYSIANKKFNKHPDKEDLIQEGMIGLLKADRTYNPARNTSFATYASICIYRNMLTYIRNNKNSEILFCDLDDFQIENFMNQEEEIDITRTNFIANIDQFLSPAEITIINRIANGYKNKELAREFNITTEAIRHRIKNLRIKLGGILK